MKHGLLTVRVVRKVAEAVDICTLELADPDGDSLPPFSAGSHIDVHVSDGLVRQYSLCNGPGERDRYRLGVLRDPNTRGGSARIHDALKEGDLIQISEPKNHFPLAHGVSNNLLLAGGIGITPILCMADHLANTASSFTLHYCTRSRERTAFLDRIQTSPFADQVFVHFDDGSPDQKLDLAALIASQSPETHLYVCGPAGFIEAVVNTARTKGWSSDRVHLEYFSPPEQSFDQDTCFEVRIASTGETFTIPAEKTVMDVLARNGVDIPCSCEQGVCGTCVTRILEGEPDHRDHYLTDREKAANDQFTPCCSRAKTPLLVLDL